jgi:histidine triad (HIT) family protein
MTSSSCIFCKIIANEAPAGLVYQDETVCAFHDIRHVAPTHILIVPKRHIASINDLTPKDEYLVGHLFSIAQQIAEQEGIRDSGYRMIINTGPDAGQIIFHLHVHLIGGQHMRFPIG